MNMNKFQIGDYIYYNDEYYNGGGYSYSTKYGCIIDIDNHCISTIIQHNGGKIWMGVEPKGKIDEEKFLSKFYLINENKKSILKIKDKLSENLRLLIEKIDYESFVKTIKKVFNYSLKNILKNKNEKIKISPESWYIEWYVYYILRSYEPCYIKDTLTYCGGANQLIKDFMNDNINFMINLQFLSGSYKNIIIFLIEEKILEYKHEKNIISDSYFSKNVFPTRIKKLEKNLNFKILNTYENFILSFCYMKTTYKIKLDMKDLFNTKFIFLDKNNRYYENKQSKCLKKKLVTKEWLQNVQIKDGKEEPSIKDDKIITFDKKTSILKIEKDKNIFFETQLNCSDISNILFTDKFILNKKTFEIINIKTLKKTIINHNNKYSSIKINKTGDIIIFIDSYSYVDSQCNIIKITLYSSKNGHVLGSFEFNYDSYEILHDINVEIL